MEILLSLAYLLKMLVFVAKKLCGGWLDDAWSNNLPNLGSRSPVKMILVLCFVAMQPIESHVHGLQSLGHNAVGE